MTLRAHGAMRVLGVFFHGVWLLGWAVGELAVLGGMGAVLYFGVPLIQDAAASQGGSARLLAVLLLGVLAFMGGWLYFWSQGGAHAFGQMVALLAGEERFEVGPELLRRERTLGRWRWERRWPLAQVTRVWVEHRGGALYLKTREDSERICDFGTREERQALAEHIQRAVEALGPSVGAYLVPGPAAPGA